MRIDRQMVAEQIEQMMNGTKSFEDIGWWAFGLLLEDLEFEPGHARLLEDVLRSLHYFHETDPVMRQFYPDSTEMVYYLRCLQGEEIYRRSAVVHWRV